MIGKVQCVAQRKDGAQVLMKTVSNALTGEAHFFLLSPCGVTSCADCSRNRGEPGDICKDISQRGISADDIKGLGLPNAACDYEHCKQHNKDPPLPIRAGEPHPDLPFKKVVPFYFPVSCPTYPTIGLQQDDDGYYRDEKIIDRVCADSCRDIMRELTIFYSDHATKLKLTYPVCALKEKNKIDPVEYLRAVPVPGQYYLWGLDAAFLIRPLIGQSQDPHMKLLLIENYSLKGVKILLPPPHPLSFFNGMCLYPEWRTTRFRSPPCPSPR